MGLSTFTLIHILLSLAGIVSGLVVLGGWLAGKQFQGWTAFFLVTTATTSVTGFFFPFRGFTPAYGVGIISLFVLAPAWWFRQWSLVNSTLGFANRATESVTSIGWP